MLGDTRKSVGNVQGIVDKISELEYNLESSERKLSKFKELIGKFEKRLKDHFLFFWKEVC